ncbi:MAG: hypothetical protein WBG36_11140 [Ornithinimicrobium sp.]
MHTAAVVSDSTSKEPVFYQFDDCCRGMGTLRAVAKLNNLVDFLEFGASLQDLAEGDVDYTGNVAV